MTVPDGRLSSIRYTVEPRDVPAQKAARRLHLTLSEFQEMQANLYARGFPEADPTTGMFDLKKIDLWMDARTAGETLQDRLRRIAVDNNLRRGRP